MTAKKVVPLREDQKKIWGWFDEDGDIHEDMTLAQAEKAALEYKGKYPREAVVIFKKVATVEVKPYIKGA